MIIAETDRLTIRALCLADAPFILRLLNEPSFVQFIGDRGVRTLEQARRYLQHGPIDSYQRYGFGLYLTELKSSKVPVGICGLIKRDALRDVDIGFAFLPEFWSKGYAFEAASAVLHYGREVVGLERIVAIVTPANDRSIRVLEKLGLKFERMLPWPEDGSVLRLYATAA